MYKTLPTKYHYNEMIERLKSAVDFYEKTDYKYNDFKAFLSNNKRIKFSFRKHHIPHLLGINIFNLKNRKILTATTPFEMLEELIERSGYIYRKIEKGEINFFEIFSEYIEEKIDSFETILKFDLKDIHFACEYIKARAYINGEANNYGCDYYIGMKNENNQYVFLGLKEDESLMFYVPSSVLACFSKEENEKILEGLLKNQVITLVNAVGYSNISRRRNLNVHEKMLLLKELINLDETYGSISNISSDYLFSLNKVSSSFDDKNISESIIDQLILSISQAKPVSDRTIEYAKTLDNQIFLRLLESYNISFSSITRKDISEEIKELNSLREQLLETEKRIKEQEKLLLQKTDTIKEQEIKIEEQNSKIEEQNFELVRLREFESESIQLVKRFCIKTDN